MGVIADGNIIEADDILGCMRTTAEAGEAIAIGKACYIKESDGKAYISDSSSANFFTGIAYAGVDSGADITLVTKGKWVTTGLSDKEIYYLGSSGAISTTVSGIRIGSADGTTDLYIDTGVNNEGSGNVGLKLLKMNPFGVLATNAPGFILPFSSVLWEMKDSRTTDGGATKVAGGATQQNGWMCKEDTTKALNCSSTSISLYTTDSGTTWSAPSSAWNATAITGADYTNDGLIVVCGLASSGKGLVFSTDDGDNWAQATTAPASVAGVNMHDATHGILIEYATGAIYWTKNAGVDWTDSGHTVSSHTNVQRAAVYCYASGANLTDFKCLIMQRRNGTTGSSGVVGTVEYYDGSDDSAAIYYGAATSYVATATNFTMLDNGTLCFAYANGHYSVDDNDIQSAQIVACTNPTDSVMAGGVMTTVPTFYQIPLGLCGIASGTDVFGKTNDTMQQYDTNKILISGSYRKLWQINLGGLV